MNKVFYRILLFFVALSSVLTLPWWISVLLLAGLTIYYPTYVEVLFLSFTFDLLYSRDFTFPYMFLTSAFVFLLAVLFIKTRIRT